MTRHSWYQRPSPRRGRCWVAVISLAAAGGSITACNDRPEIWTASQRLLGPHRVAKQVLWVEATRGAVIALDPGESPPRVHRLTIGRNALFASPDPSRERLLVLTAGKEALRKDQQAEAPQLVLIEPSSSGLKLERRFELQAAFDRLAVSDDGRFAVAHYAESSSDTAAVFRNPNEIALFDLEAEPSSDNPVLRTLRSFGSAPLGVVFSPPMAVPAGGEERTLALVLARNYVTLVDMDHRGRSEITVPLSPADSTRAVTPAEVIFVPEQPAVYVRADGTTDLFALTLEGKAAEGEGANDFRPSINQPSAGKTVLDMAIVPGDGKASTRILTANASSDLSLIDAATSEFVTIDVGEPVDTILLVPREAPELALLYSSRQPQPRIHFLQLEGLAERREANLTHRSLAKPVHQLVPVPGDELALVVHNDARDVISLLDLVGEHHTDTPIQGRRQLHSFDFAGDYLVGVTPGIARLGVIDLQNLHPFDLRLDHDPQQVIAIDSTLVIDHGAPAGLVTIVPRPDAERSDARVLWGFILGDLLNLGLED